MELETDETHLSPPTDVTFSHGAGGGWAVQVRWEYGYRIDEIDHFVLKRRSQGSDAWEEVARRIPNSERTWTDLLPDGLPYSYSVTAVTRDGQSLTSDPARHATDTRAIKTGQSEGYIRVDQGTARPSGIRKPLPSTQRAVFVVWDPHPAASEYQVDALDSKGRPYATTTVSDPDRPIALITGEHPDRHFTARVTVLRRDRDGKLQPVSHSEQRIELDSVRSPHCTVWDFHHEPDRTYGAVIALSEGQPASPLHVDGSPCPDGWQEYDGHYAAVIHYVTPRDKGVTATVCSSPPFAVAETP